MDHQTQDPREEEAEVLKTKLRTRLPRLFKELGIRHRYLKYLQRGSYNLVFRFTDSSDSSKHVIRVAIDPSEDEDCTMSRINGYPNMTDHAAVLNLLEMTKDFFGSTPKLSHYDATNNNQAGRPFMIQSFIEGEENQSFVRQSESEKLQAVKILAELTAKQEAVRFPKSGKLQAPPEYGETGSPDSKKLKSLIISTFKRPEHVLQTYWHKDTTIRDWLYQLIDHRAQIDRQHGYRPKPWRALRGMMQQMDASGVFNDPEGNQLMSKAVLRHGDLHFGNVLFTRNEQGILSLAGVIDWDQAEAAPLALARKPPYFLWEPASIDDDKRLFNYWNEDSDYLPNHYWSQMTAEDRLVKSTWDQFHSDRDPTYMDDAYGRGLWIRRVATLAMWGIHDKQEAETLEWLLDEWEDQLHAHRQKSNSVSDTGSLLPESRNSTVANDCKPIGKSQKTNRPEGNAPSEVSQKKRKADNGKPTKEPRKKRKTDEAETNGNRQKERKADDTRLIVESHNSAILKAGENHKRMSDDEPAEKNLKKRKLADGNAARCDREQGIEPAEKDHKKQKLEDGEPVREKKPNNDRMSKPPRNKPKPDHETYGKKIRAKPTNAQRNLLMKLARGLE
ncbi:MAG: hypothetical protein M1831_006375 [Alyxoria varia]|nr:MAG: hypothetical protein M1831_006375 [Alyxoria varia]